MHARTSARARARSDDDCKVSQVSRLTVKCRDFTRLLTTEIYFHRDRHAAAGSS